MLPIMKLLTIRVLLVLLALLLGVLWAPAVGYFTITARLYGTSPGGSIKDMWEEAKFLAYCWVEAFKNPYGDEDDVNGV